MRVWGSEASDRCIDRVSRWRALTLRICLSPAKGHVILRPIDLCSMYRCCFELKSKTRHPWRRLLVKQSPHTRVAGSLHEAVMRGGSGLCAGLLSRPQMVSVHVQVARTKSVVVDHVVRPGHLDALFIRSQEVETHRSPGRRASCEVSEPTNDLVHRYRSVSLILRRIPNAEYGLGCAEAVSLVADAVEANRIAVARGVDLVEKSLDGLLCSLFRNVGPESNEQQSLIHDAHASPLSWGSTRFLEDPHTVW